MKNNKSFWVKPNFFEFVKLPISSQISTVKSKNSKPVLPVFVEPLSMDLKQILIILPFFESF